MMKCLVFSDSHGSFALMKKALDMNPDAEVVFFLGDGVSDAIAIRDRYPEKAWINVKGNCDVGISSSFYDIKKVEKIKLSGYSIVLTHGDLYGAKYGDGGLLNLAREMNADIVLFGHTHTKKYTCVTDFERPIHLFNPGSISVTSGSFGIITLGDVPHFSHGSFA